MDPGQIPHDAALHIFLSEAIRPTATKFGMLVNLVNIYQEDSNYSPGVKNGPYPEVISVIYRRT